MLYRVTAIAGCRIYARDGEIGLVDDIYFDDERWVVRYLVVTTSDTRKVLISPYAVEQVAPSSHLVSLNLTREKVENSPGIDTDKPFSRQREADYFHYHRYPAYWSSPTLWANGAVPMIMPPQAEQGIEIEAHVDSAELDDPSGSDFHLRSTREVTGYRVVATDHRVGHVLDFLIDERTWAISYLIVDTREWLRGEEVLVAPKWIRSVDWSEKAVSVDRSREEIKRGIEADPERSGPA